MKEITPEEVASKLENSENIHLVDVRENEEVARGMIQGAKHIPLGELSERTDELDKDTPYVMICRSGGRSSMACSILDKQGFDTANMKGGMLAWEGPTDQDAD